MANNYNRNYKKQNQPDIITTIVVGFFKLIWWIVTLPFKGLNRGKGIGADDRAYLINKRHEIENLLRSESEIELKHAVMEADKLVDYKLKLLGCSGATFADRLRSAEKSMSKSMYNSIWDGHKVRNQIAHENELRIMNNELREAAENLLNYIKQG